MKIDTSAKRLRLKLRREPYWHQISKGKFLGYRRTSSGGSWVARMRGDDNKQRYHSLGDYPKFEDALKAASVWMESVSGVDNHRYTLRNAVDDYVKHLEINNSKQSSRDVKLRLNKHIPTSLLNTELSILKTAQLKRLHNGMVKTDGDEEEERKSKDSANRVLAQLKAALNLAFRDGHIASDTEWNRVSAFKNVTSSRKLFLTDKQVNTLLEKTVGGFHRLVKAGVLTGARYGELTRARVKDFDPRDSTIELTGKTGHRICYLSDGAMKFFKDICKDRLPEAILLAKDDGNPWGKSHHLRSMREAVEKAKLPGECVFYSLRHYHVSKALLSGMPMQVVAENAGTSVRMIEKHYGKFTKTDRRQMMNEVVLG
ncbi:MAG: hypothetical protein E2O62_04190 [Gammaproteobacteria bacterium]|nr:MAG: hypothetical protein E2O62_04190 [Gammaproteobacteria bacterium]